MAATKKKQRDNPTTRTGRRPHEHETTGLRGTLHRRMGGCMPRLEHAQPKHRTGEMGKKQVARCMHPTAMGKKSTQTNRPRRLPLGKPESDNTTTLKGAASQAYATGTRKTRRQILKPLPSSEILSHPLKSSHILRHRSARFRLAASPQTSNPHPHVPQ